MDAACQLAQLLEGLVHLLARGRDQPDGFLGVDLDPVLGEAERDRQRHQPLLRAVVEVALDPPPRGVPGLDQPGARSGELLDARLELRVQTLALQRDVGGGANDLQQLRLVVQRRVVDERRDVLAIVFHRPGGAS